ncbi:hypothetical protein FOL47_002505 [Perkinsus chesapeaki]|uniref:Uncharacterized protein n=1 Tax=Perkinsus chesapeaki TaxID=330153 RepID=A0A7J6N0M7_PERCH|nr:hypothetical protein FOL47_002505 [Perkinsus chesapeaki]
MDFLKRINDILDAADAEADADEGASPNSSRRSKGTDHGPTQAEDSARAAEVVPVVESSGRSAWMTSGSSWVKGISNKASAALQNMGTPSPPGKAVSLGSYPPTGSSPVVPDHLFGSAAAADEDLLEWESEAATSTWRPSRDSTVPKSSTPTVTASDVFGGVAPEAGRMVSAEEEGSDEEIGVKGAVKEPLGGGQEIEQAPQPPQGRPEEIEQAPQPPQGRPEEIEQAPHPPQGRPEEIEQAPQPPQGRPEEIEQAPQPPQGLPEEIEQAPQPPQGRPEEIVQAPQPPQESIDPGKEAHRSSDKGCSVPDSKGVELPNEPSTTKPAIIHPLTLVDTAAAVLRPQPPPPPVADSDGYGSSTVLFGEKSDDDQSGSSARGEGNVVEEPHLEESGGGDDDDDATRSPPPPPPLPDTTDESPSLSTTPRLTTSEASSEDKAVEPPTAGGGGGDHTPGGRTDERSGDSSGSSLGSRVMVEENTRMLLEKAETLERLLADSKSRLNDLEKAFHLKDEELDDLQRTYADEIAKTVGRGDGSLQSLRREMQRLRQRCVDLQEELQRQMRGSERDVEAARQEMEGELALLLGQKDTLLETDLTAARSKCQSMDASSSSEITKLRRELGDYSEANAELKNAYANANAEVERLSAAMAEGSKRSEEMEKSLADAELRAENASTESAKLAQQVFELQTSLHEKDFAAATSEAVASAKKQASDLEESLKDKTSALARAEEELRQASSRAESDKQRLMSRIASLESELDSTKASLANQASPPDTDLQDTISRLQRGMTQAAQGHVREVEVLQKRISEKDRRIEALVCEVNTYRNEQQDTSTYKQSGRRLSEMELGEMSPVGTPTIGRNKRIRDGMVELRPNRGSPVLKLINEIDSVCRGLVRQLLRSPFARVLLLLYFIALHVWVLLVLHLFRPPFMLNTEFPEQELAVRNLVLSVCDLKQHGDAPQARAAGRAATIGTRMYLFGGADDRRCFGNDGEIHLLEIEQMKWTRLQGTGDLPKARFGHTLHVISDTDLLLFGGLCTAEGSTCHPEFLGPNAPAWSHGAAEPSADLYIFNTRTLVWSRPTLTSSDCPSGRYLHSSAVAGENLVVYGGLAASGEPNGEVWVLNLSTWHWQKMSPSIALPPAFGHAMATFNKDIYSFGGNYGDEDEGENLNELYKFSIKSGNSVQVSICDINNSTAPCQRRFHSMDVIAGRLYVLAGASSPSSTNFTDLYVYDTVASRWSRPLYDGSPIALRAHTTTVLHDKLLIFGGVRDKPGSDEVRISKKLFFLNVLEIKEGATEGDFKFKLVSVGDSGVGKSCLLTRFVNDVYSDFHVSTIGVDFKTVVTMVKGRLVKLQLWDTAGQERFSVVTGNYYRNADGFVLVYDATSKSSFDHIDQWLSQIQQHHDLGPNTIKILVGNKYDLSSEVVITEFEGEKKAKQIGAFFVAASAKTASNVDLAFLTGAQKLVEMRREQQQAQQQRNNVQRLQLESGEPSASTNFCTQSCATR